VLRFAARLKKIILRAPKLHISNSDEAPILVRMLQEFFAHAEAIFPLLPMLQEFFAHAGAVFPPLRMLQ